MNSTTSILQHLKQINRDLISEISMDIALLKALKRNADEQGNIEAEYAFHNDVVNAKRELKKFVALQIFTKAALRAEYETQRAKKAELMKEFIE